ncbi:MAG: aspartate carbamoyltransferase [Solobacterium sp.]|nr:aspartate carbamoyltransferase [Solobacterium sp.]
MMEIRNLISITDFSVEEIDKMIGVAEDIMTNPDKYIDICKGKKLATLFFEPSTRTRLSFEAAMLELGGSVLGFSEASSSSASKGESVSDTIRTVGCYADIIAMRHPKEGAPIVAARRTTVPIINGGDGGHHHPTQTLTDLLTITREKGRLNNLTVGLCGDLKFGRTVHSLIEAMLRYENVKFVLIAPPELRVPQYIIDMLEKAGAAYKQVETMEAVMPELDILYMTRVQRERFFNEEDYIRLKDTYILNMDKLANAKKDMAILHPLPRVNEISVEVDDDPRAAYFRQALCGKYIRMALILNLLNIVKEVQ